jgi:acyl-CoA reductase-like NAD-dependent aldehyde dehydrogenase
MSIAPLIRQVLVGGQLTNHRSGQFYPPTVITGVTRDMRIWTEEVFGPVIVIVKGGFAHAPVGTS